MYRVRTWQCVIATAVVVAACGDARSSAPTTPDTLAPPDASADASAPSSTTLPTAPSSDAPTSSTPATPSTAPTSEPEPAPTTDPDTPRVDVVNFDFPSGTLTAGPSDVLVLGTDGDLRRYPDALGSGGAAPVRLVDNPDPFGPVQEGPGPNVIDDVAGLIDGAVVYGECCEPISGTVLAVAAPDGDPVVSGLGTAPTLSPDGSRLATVNNQALTVVDTASGEGGVHLFEPDPDDLTRSPTDVEWAGDDTVAVAVSTSSGWSLELFDATTFVRGAVVDLDVRSVADGASVRFAGRTSDGELAVEIDEVDRVIVRFFDPVSLDPGERPEQVFPTGVAGIEIDERGAGLTWVDDFTAYFLPAGEFEARPIASDALAAWFVRTV